MKSKVCESSKLTPASNLSDPERATRARSLESKEKELQRQAEDFKNDSQSESQQVFQRVAQKVYAFLQTYSQQHGYSAVIERGSDAARLSGTRQQHGYYR